MKRIARTTVVLVGATLLAASTAGPSSATPSHWEYYHGEYGPEVSFCGDLVQRGETDGRFRTVVHGPDGLPYEFDRATFTDTWTNPTTAEFATVKGVYRGGALHVTDNGDGTTTIQIKNTGSTKVYDASGDLITRSGGGLFAFELLLDNAGTPTDPSDDEVIAFLGVVKRAGQVFSVCDVLTDAIG